jgi:hypothetical protein
MEIMSERFHKKENASTGLSVLLGICVGAAICFVAYLLVGQSGTPLRLWSPVVVDPSGKETILGDTRQLEFWTPSVKTKDYLLKDTNGAFADSEKWQVFSNEDALLKFGNILHTNKNILGYRRVEAWGQGRTPFKAGWWWTVNVMTNYSAAELGQTYQSFWSAQQTVFIEVIDNRGRSE